MEIAGKEITRSSVVIVSLLVLGVIFAIILFVIFRGDADNDGNNADSLFGTLFGTQKITPSEENPLRGGIVMEEKKEGTVLYRISEAPVIGATLSPNGTHVRYFKQTTGHLFESEFTGANEMRISNITIPAIQNVQWTPSKEYAILSYYTDGSLRRLYTQYSGTSTITSSFLPNNIQEITTSLTDNMIAYTITSPEETTIVTARPNNTGVKTVYSTPIQDLEISVPAANRIALKTKSSAYAPGTLYMLNPSSKQLTRVLAEKEGLDVLWSPDGNNFLTMETVKEGTQVSLRVVSLKDNKVTSLPFATLPEKCVWAPSPKTQTLYCAVPSPIPPGTNLPDEWWQGSVSFDDALWRISLDTNTQEQILPPYQLDATNLFLSKDESFVFFTNKKDGSLWSLHLK